MDRIHHFALRLLHDLVRKKDGMDIGRSFPLFLRDLPAQRLGSVLAHFEPFVKLLDIPRGILFILLVCDAVHSCAGFLSGPRKAAYNASGVIR